MFRKTILSYVFAIMITLSPLALMTYEFFFDFDRTLANYQPLPVKFVPYVHMDVVQDVLVAMDYELPKTIPVPEKKPDLVATILDLDSIQVSESLVKRTNCENHRDNELISMACNLYHEARGEGEIGMIAVAEVVMNRVDASHYPNKVVNVIYQKHQFSWTKDGKSDIINEMVPWLNALKIAKWFLDGNNSSITQNALYYHADYIRPKWASRFVRTAYIGSHIFYRYA